MLIQKRKFACSPIGTYRPGTDGKLSVDLTRSGKVLSVSAGNILLSRTLGNHLEGGLGRIFLRIHDKKRMRLHTLLGPSSAMTHFASSQNQALWNGFFDDLKVALRLFVAADTSMLFWEVDIMNCGDRAVRCDVVWVQDVGLASRNALLSNEAYAAHYVDATVLNVDEEGPVLLYRQNLKQADEFHPWLMLACLSGAHSFATDAFDVYGNAYRCGEPPSGLNSETLANHHRQYEFTCGALQSRPHSLQSGQCGSVRFGLTYLANHPEASSDKDRSHLKRMKAFENSIQWADIAIAERVPAPNIVASAELFHASDVTRASLEDLYPRKWRHLEEREGEIMSFFVGVDTHVITRAKERLLDRPHGSILIGNASRESIREPIATTVYASGIFGAQTVYGNTSFHQMNSLPRDPLGLSRCTGLRVYMQDGNCWKLLGMPSLFEMTRDACRWLYMNHAGEIVVTVTVSMERGRDAIGLSIEANGNPRVFLIANELVMGASEHETKTSIEVDEDSRVITFSADGKSFAAERDISLTFGIQWDEFSHLDSIGGSEMLGASENDRDSILVMKTEATSHFSMRLTGSLDGMESIIKKLTKSDVVTENEYWHDFNRGLDFQHDSSDVSRIHDALRWYSHNALIHYASPHGLEQYSGAAWGTRDVCQGPFEYFIAQQHDSLARSILLITYSHQYEATGDWPQWFMHDEYSDIAQYHSHGDIVVWPLKALALYLDATGDFGLLDQPVSYTGRDGLPTDRIEPLESHVARALDRIEGEFIPGTALMRYGEGDWDDSLQPANSELAGRLVSGWTVALLAQALKELTHILAGIEHGTSRFQELLTRISKLERRVRTSFRRYVLIDGVVAGFLLYDEGFKNARPLLHPRDTQTGISYRLIPMTRAILAELLTKEEATRHIQLIEDNLKCPDGVRLMNKPAPYHGGKETCFRRAESAANFGREIGLQYVHAHIRYAEALAKLGDAEGFFQALLTICPVGLEHTVPNAGMRQSNMYFSSSDGDFLDRYEAEKNFEKLRRGEITVKGGWRLYSSGPGLFLGLVLRCLFGLRESADAWTFDPVMPIRLDGIALQWELSGLPVKIEYRMSEKSHGPDEIICNGTGLKPCGREHNPYRKGGLCVKKSLMISTLDEGHAHILVR